eukprot:1962530-Alexandrium_andersonii.AAC.1
MSASLVGSEMCIRDRQACVRRDGHTCACTHAQCSSMVPLTAQSSLLRGAFSLRLGSDGSETGASEIRGGIRARAWGACEN